MKDWTGFSRGAGAAAAAAAARPVVRARPRPRGAGRPGIRRLLLQRLPRAVVPPRAGRGGAGGARPLRRRVRGVPPDERGPGDPPRARGERGGVQGERGGPGLQLRLPGEHGDPPRPVRTPGRRLRRPALPRQPAGRRAPVAREAPALPAQRPGAPRPDAREAPRGVRAGAGDDGERLQHGRGPRPPRRAPCRLPPAPLPADGGRSPRHGRVRPAGARVRRGGRDSPGRWTS